MCFLCDCCQSFAAVLDESSTSWYLHLQNAFILLLKTWMSFSCVYCFNIWISLFACIWSKCINQENILASIFPHRARFSSGIELSSFIPFLSVFWLCTLPKSIHLAIWSLFWCHCWDFGENLGLIGIKCLD